MGVYAAVYNVHENLPLAPTCLGSVDTPCAFATSSALVLGEGQSLEKKSKKGGATNEAAEVLKERRPKMQPGQYFPPACFSCYDAWQCFKR